MAAPAKLQTLVDTATGYAVAPEMLNEAREVVGIACPDQAMKVDAMVQLTMEPAGLLVTIRTRAASNFPPGITMIHTASHTLDKQVWVFKKEAEATCVCGAVVGRSDSGWALKHAVTAHGAEAAAAHRVRADQAVSSQPLPDAASLLPPIPLLSLDGTLGGAPQPPPPAPTPPLLDTSLLAQGGPDAMELLTGALMPLHGGLGASHGPQAEAMDVDGPSMPQPPAAPMPPPPAPPPPVLDPNQHPCAAFAAEVQRMPLDLGLENRMRALGGLLGASVAGYSDPAVYDLGLARDAQAAFEEVSRAVLEDESLLGITSFVRPARGILPHAADPGAELAALPPWVRATADIPLTVWALLSQPWHLQYAASRGLPGVKGADMCLPARRAASKVRAEFATLDAFDNLSFEEQSATQPPRVPTADVIDKLGTVLARSRDWRSPAQFARRLGVSLDQFATLVNLREIGALAIDMCCRCGLFVVDGQPALSCEHCVDVYHLQCVGLRSVPDGDWVCPSCTLASGATGKAAAAAEALGRSRSVGRGARGQSRNTRAGRQASLDSPGAGRSRGRSTSLASMPSIGPPQPPPPSGGSGAPQPPRAQSLAPLPPRPPPATDRASGGGAGGSGSDAEDADGDGSLDEEDEGEEDGEDEEGPGGAGSGAGPARKRARGDPASRRRVRWPRPSASEVYQTHSPGMPPPGSEGRMLVVRIATTFLGKQVSPTTPRWCVQWMVSLSLLAGVNTEYHHTVNTGRRPIALSDATIVHRGLRCNRCAQRPEFIALRQLKQEEGNAPDEGTQANPAGPPSDREPSQPLPLLPCGQTFRKLTDYEDHIRVATGCPAAHMWLPKHRMYLQGLGPSKGLAELSAEEAQRNTGLADALVVAKRAAEAARAAAVAAGRDPDSMGEEEIDTLKEPGRRRGTRGPGDRSRGGGRGERSASTRARVFSFAPPREGAAPPPASRRLGLDGGGPPQPPPPPPPKREEGPAPEGFDAAAVAAKAAQVRAIMALRMSDTNVVAQIPNGAGGANGACEGATTAAATPPPGDTLHMQLVQVAGKPIYAFVPRAAVEALAAEHPAVPAADQAEITSGPGAGGEDAAGENANASGNAAPPTQPAAQGDAVSSGVDLSSGIAVVPEGLLPQLLAAGGRLLEVDGSPLPGEEPKPPQPAPAAPDATATKVLSLKLLRLFTTLGAKCPPGTPAGALLATLRGCRDTAGALAEQALQAEALGVVLDLTSQLEGVADGVYGTAVMQHFTAVQQGAADLQAQLAMWLGGPQHLALQMG